MSEQYKPKLLEIWRKTWQETTESRTQPPSGAPNWTHVYNFEVSSADGFNFQRNQELNGLFDHQPSKYLSTSHFLIYLFLLSLTLFWNMKCKDSLNISSPLRNVWIEPVMILSALMKKGLFIFVLLNPFFSLSCILGSP